MDTDTLVITSCLQPASDVPFLSITDSNIRLKQLCCSILSWASEPAIKKIILCDNSDPKYDFAPLREVLDQHGKQSEVLLFEGSFAKVVSQGKGYGEGEIMNYVFENSELISSSDSFYKSTGRLYIRNFDHLHQMHKQSRRVFENPISSGRRFAKKLAIVVNTLSRHGVGRVGTVFYKCDVPFFKGQLLERYYLVNDGQRFTLEHSYFQPLIRHGFSVFKDKPLIVGHSGTTGRLYHSDNDYSSEINMQGINLAKKILYSDVLSVSTSGLD